MEIDIDARNRKLYLIGFSWEEQLDMIRCYYKSDCKQDNATLLYTKLYPDRKRAYRSTILAAVTRARYDLNIDMHQFLPTADDGDTSDSENQENYENEKDKLRLITSLTENLPIVYTTRLDEMNIFKKDFLKVGPKRFLKAILIESKPKLDTFKTYSNENENTHGREIQYVEMVQKLHAKNLSHKRRKSTSKYSDDDDFEVEEIEVKINETSDVIVIDDDVIDEYDKLSSDPNYTTAHTSNNIRIDEDDVVDYVHTNSRPCVKPTQHFEDITVIDEHVIIENCRSAFLSFSCIHTKVTDLYYIDNKGFVILHNCVTLDENMNVSEYVGSMKTFRCFYCCWYKRREQTLLFNKLPKETMGFIRERHMCILTTCICCCSPQQFKAKTHTVINSQRNESNVFKLKENDMFSRLEHEMNTWQTQRKQKTTAAKKSKITMVDKENKWMQEVISSIQKFPPNKNSFRKEILLPPRKNSSKNYKLLKPNIIYRPDCRIVFYVSSNELMEIYELNAGKLISNAICTVSKMNHIMEKLAKDICLTYKDSSDQIVIINVSAKCCWYFREALINARNGAYDFMRQPHACIVGYCTCCCKSLEQVKINDRIPSCIKSKFYNRRLGEFEDTNYLIHFENTCHAYTLPIYGKSYEKQAFPIPINTNLQTTNSKNKVTTAQYTFNSSSAISLVDDLISDIDEKMSNVPLSSPPCSMPAEVRKVSNSHAPENPSSKITLFSPEMACTITTYAITSNETTDENLVSDPLAGNLSDIEDYCVDPLTDIQNEMDLFDAEDNKETVNNDIESDPLIYTNMNRLINNETSDPLATHDSVIEIKDETNDDNIASISAEIDEQIAAAALRMAPSTEIDDKITAAALQMAPSTTDVNVEQLISTILDRFRTVRLFINEEGNVSADLGVCVTTLTQGELKVLSNILSHAQEQVKNLGLLPGTVLRGHVPVNNESNTSTHETFEPNNIPNYTVPETDTGFITPRIENVFSLKHSLGNQPATDTKSSKIRVRPMEQLSVTNKIVTESAQMNPGESLQSPISSSWLQKALTSKQKPMTVVRVVKGKHPIYGEAQPSSSTLDSSNIPKFIISKGSSVLVNNNTHRANPPSPPPPPPPPPSKKRVRKPRNHPLAKKFDELRKNFLESRSLRRIAPKPSKTTSSSSPVEASTSTSSPVVCISIDSDDD